MFGITWTHPVNGGGSGMIGKPPAATGKTEFKGATMFEMRTYLCVHAPQCSKCFPLEESKEENSFHGSWSGSSCTRSRAALCSMVWCRSAAIAVPARPTNILAASFAPLGAAVARLPWLQLHSLCRLRAHQFDSLPPPSGAAATHPQSATCIWQLHRHSLCPLTETRGSTAAHPPLQLLR